MKIATVDKDTRVGDPRFVDTPVEELTSKEYGARMAERIRRREKTHVPRLNVGGRESKDTTHVSVVDGDGNCVSLTHSLGRPSGVVTEGLGFMYNGCMGVFDPRPGRAGSLAPGKARFTAMCPTILFDADGPWYVVGAPGGTFITMGVLQAILNVVDFRMGAQESVSAPRFCTTSDTIDVTNRILRRTQRALEDMGYPVRRSAQSFQFRGCPRPLPHRQRLGGRCRPRPRRHGPGRVRSAFHGLYSARTADAAVAGGSTAQPVAWPRGRRAAS